MKWRNITMWVSLPIFILLIETTSFAALFFSLNGSSSNYYLGLQTQTKRALSGSVAIGLGTYFRIGITLRESFDLEEGYTLADKESNTYLWSTSEVLTTANSLDFTLILYQGEILVPYLQVGFVRKHYDITRKTVQEDGLVLAKGSTTSLPPLPNGGFGVGLRLNRSFSLKLSYMVSLGVSQRDPNSEADRVLDSYSTIGISYNI